MLELLTGFSAHHGFRLREVMTAELVRVSPQSLAFSP
jgi:hypothetical protein